MGWREKHFEFGPLVLVVACDGRHFDGVCFVLLKLKVVRYCEVEGERDLAVVDVVFALLVLRSR